VNIINVCFVYLDKKEGAREEKRRLSKFGFLSNQNPDLFTYHSQDTVQELRPTQFVRESVILPGELPGVDNPLL